MAARIKAVRRDVMRILACREAAQAALKAEMPPDCSMVARWVAAKDGLRRFVADGWGDRAAALGWTPEELYRTPPLWRQIHLTGAALLVGDRKVIAVTADNIVIETRSKSQLKFRRIGREHIA
jgi:hypothetical protein